MYADEDAEISPGEELVLEQIKSESLKESFSAAIEALIPKCEMQTDENDSSQSGEFMFDGEVCSFATNGAGDKKARFNFKSIELINGEWEIYDVKQDGLYQIALKLPEQNACIIYTLDALENGIPIGPSQKTPDREDPIFETSDLKKDYAKTIEELISKYQLSIKYRPKIQLFTQTDNCQIEMMDSSHIKLLYGQFSIALENNQWQIFDLGAEPKIKVDSLDFQETLAAVALEVLKNAKPLEEEMKAIKSTLLMSTDEYVELQRKILEKLREVIPSYKIAANDKPFIFFENIPQQQLAILFLNPESPEYHLTTLTDRVTLESRLSGEISWDIFELDSDRNAKKAFKKVTHPPSKNDILNKIFSIMNKVPLKISAAAPLMPKIAKAFSPGEPPIARISESATDQIMLESRRNISQIKLRKDSELAECVVVPAEPDGNCAFTAIRRVLLLKGLTEIAKEITREKFIELFQTLKQQENADEHLKQILQDIFKDAKVESYEEWNEKFKDIGYHAADVHLNLLSWHYNITFHIHCINKKVETYFKPERSYETIDQRQNLDVSAQKIDIYLAHIAITEEVQALNHFDGIIVTPTDREKAQVAQLRAGENESTVFNTMQAALVFGDLLQREHDQGRVKKSVHFSKDKTTVIYNRYDAPSPDAPTRES